MNRLFLFFVVTLTFPLFCAAGVNEDTLALYSKCKGGRDEAMIDHVKHKSTQSSYLKPTPPSLDEEWSDTLIHRDDFPLFFLLADFYFNHPTQYSLPFQGAFESKHFSTEPLVLTGEQILHTTSMHVPFVRREAHTFLQNSFNFFREQDIGAFIYQVI